MASLWFIVPAHGRSDLAEICLWQLQRTCEELRDHGFAADAVVIADDENYEIASEIGFGTVRQKNVPLGRKWNDGYEYAAGEGADFLVPFGSDDWLDPVLIFEGDLPPDDTIRCCRMSAVVSPDGQRIAPLRISYDGGDGVRILPRKLLEPLGFRPAEDDRLRAIDTSSLQRISRSLGRLPRLSYVDVHPLQIVDWKSPREQLNSYTACLSFLEGPELRDPFVRLEPHFPSSAIEEMKAFYAQKEATTA